MEEKSYARVKAVHSSWTGWLRLSNNDSSIFHEEHNTKGSYSLEGGKLIVKWERYGMETFVRAGSHYVDERILSNIPKVEHLSTVSIGGVNTVAMQISALVPGSDYPVDLRLRTSDVQNFKQIFVRRDYDHPALPEIATQIVDVGANIGLATVFFGLRYPAARIISLEPDPRNYPALRNNIAGFGKRVSSQCAAVWVTDGTINLHTEDEKGFPLEPWATQVSHVKADSRAIASTYKMNTLLRNFDFDQVDILKIDIEGAELELFSFGTLEWLPRIKMIMVRTHDGFRAGCEDAVRDALRLEFEELPCREDTLVFRRVGSAG